MKKQFIFFALVLILVLSMLPACSNNNIIKFSDSNFEAAVRDAINKPTGKITREDVSKITELDVSDRNITSLSGIEYFSAVAELDCSWNQLTVLDVSRNSSLKWLFCHGNHLTALDVSKNIALVDLRCSDNQLATLDVSQNTTLMKLDCSVNNLTALNMAQHPVLETLICDENQLTQLDVSGCMALVDFRCRDNKLTALDVSQNTALIRLDCSGNNFPDQSAVIGLDESRTTTDF